MKTFFGLTADLLLFFMTLLLVATTATQAFTPRHAMTDVQLVDVMIWLCVMLASYVVCKITLYVMKEYNITIKANK